MGLFRHPRTTQEKRQNQDFREFCRPSRCPKNLPSWYDDFFKHQDRCWKNYRKVQYKIKNSRKKKDSSSYGKSMAKRDHWHFEHRKCWSCYNRCENCWKTGVWEKKDKKFERECEKYIRKQNEKMEKFWKNCEVDCFKLR